MSFDSLHGRLADHVVEFVLHLYPTASVTEGKIIVSKECFTHAGGPLKGGVEIDGMPTTLVELASRAKNLTPEETVDWCELWLSHDDDQAQGPIVDAEFDVEEPEPYPEPEPTPEPAPEAHQPQHEPEELSSPNSRALVTGKRPVDLHSQASYLPDIHRLLPQAPDAEKGVLSSYLLAPETIGDFCDEKGVTVAQFHLPAHASIFAELEYLRHQQKPVDFITLTQALRDKGLLDQVGGAAAITELFTFLPTAANCGYYVEILNEKYALREVIKTCTEYAARSYDEHDEVPNLIEEVRSKINLLADAQTQGGVRMALAARMYNSAKPPPEPVAVFTLGNHTVATPGNLCAIQAKAKAGKSAFMGAMLAASLEATGDTLGVKAENPKRGTILHFDTEQSPWDHYVSVTRALKRAGRETCPQWVRSYYLTDLSLEQRKSAIRAEVKRCKDRGEALFAIIIDGLADLCNDPNDPEESNALVDEMHRMAIDANTVVVCALHENPGSEIGKTRGHLGSQLERKAETNLRLEKDPEGVTVVFCERGRHAHIPKDKGYKFTWSDEAKMHVSTDAPFKAGKGPQKAEKAGPRKNCRHNAAKDRLGKFFAAGPVRRATLLKNKFPPTSLENYWGDLKRAGLILPVPNIPGLWQASEEWEKELHLDFAEEEEK